MGEFGKLLERAKRLGITYEYRHHDKEQFAVHYNGKTWTRDTPGGIKGLIHSLIRAAEKNEIV